MSTEFANAIEVRNLTKEYEGFTLSDITFDLPKGCILGLIGENGAGKSTTVNLIMNAMKRNTGQIKVLGVDNESEDFNRVKEDIGVVLDEAYFPGVINANVVSKMMKATYTRWNEEVFFHYIQKFNIPEKKKFKDFSKGMKMKLAIAVALSHKPRLLILDEATGGLDPIVRDEILDIFYDFTRDEEHSILISSHIVSDLEKLCDYIGFIHDGKLLFCEEKDVLLDEYGIIGCKWKELDDIPREAIVGISGSDYGAECMIRRSMVNSALPSRRADLEEIMLYLVKGEKRQ